MEFVQRARYCCFCVGHTGVCAGGGGTRTTGADPEKPASTAEPAIKPAPTTQTQPAAGRADSPGAEADTTLRLGVGDLLEVSVYNVPELTSKARVSNNGDVYLPLVGYVHVEGLTTDEAQGVIEKKLSDGGFVKGPHVTVFVDQYASQGASVLGEVARPGVYPILGQVRLFDLISAAGGLTDKAGNSVTITRRSQPDKPVSLALARNLSDSPQANIEMSPGDTVVVRKADVVYVVGDVARPSGLLIDRGTFNCAAGYRTGWWYNQNLQAERNQDSSQGPRRNYRKACRVEEDSRGQDSGRATESGRYPICA